MSKIIKLNHGHYEIIDEDEEETEAVNKPSSVPVSLPVHLFKKESSSRINDKSGNHATSGSNVLDNITLDTKDLDVVCAVITKDLNDGIKESGANVPPEINGNGADIAITNTNTHRNEETNEYNVAAINNTSINQNIGNNNLNQLPKREANVNEKQMCIRHKLPLPVIPEKEKYKIYENKTSVLKNAGANINIANDYSRNPNYCNVEAQTDSVMIIDDKLKKIVEFVKSNNISLERLQQNEKKVARKDVETMTENDLDEIINMQTIYMLQAYSVLNKELLSLIGKRLENGSFPNTVDIHVEKIRLGSVRSSFQQLFGPKFGELTKHFETENILNIRLPEPGPKKTKKRRVSTPTVAHQTKNTNSEAPTNIGQHAQTAPKHTSRPQHQTPMLPQQNFSPMPQLQEYSQMSDIAQAENNTNVHSNVPDPRNFAMNQQYQFPRIQSFQRDVTAENCLPFSNTGPRMMQPYSLHFTREQFAEYSNGGHMPWNYSQQYSDVTHNMRAPYINGDTMPSRVIPTPPKTNYQHNQVQRNNILNMPNYANSDWNINMRQNGPM